MKKRTLSLLLCIVLMFGLAVPVAYADDAAPVAEYCDCGTTTDEHDISCLSRCKCAESNHVPANEYDHVATCPLYKCTGAGCGVYLNQGESHSNNCHTLCDCGYPEATHTPDCFIYKCGYCTVYPNQGEAHTQYTCPDFACPDCGKVFKQEGTTEGCKCYYFTLFNSPVDENNNYRDDALVDEEVYIVFLDKSKPTVTFFNDNVASFGADEVTYDHVNAEDCPNYFIVYGRYGVGTEVKYYDIDSFDYEFSNTHTLLYRYTEPKYFGDPILNGVGLYATFAPMNGGETMSLYDENGVSVAVEASKLAGEYVVDYFDGYNLQFKLTTDENWPVDAAYCWISADHVVNLSQSSSVHEQEVSKTLGTHTITVSGVLPDGVGLDAAELEADMSDFIHSELLGLDALTEDEIALAYDISLQVGENKVQPDGTATVKLDGLDTNKYTEFTVYHMPNTDTETIRKVMDGETIMLDVPETLTPVTVGDGYIEFETDGFSVYYVVAGTQSDRSGNDTFYILRGTAVELTSVNSDNYTVTYPDGVTAENSGVTMARSGNTLTITATSTAQYGTYSVKISNNRTATIIILSPEDIFALPEIDNDVYFTVVSDSTEVPSEPMSGGNYTWNYIKKGTGGNYTFTPGAWLSSGRYQESPDGFLKLDVIAASNALVQNLKGQNVIGVIDSGWGNDTRPCINLTDEEWNNILKQFVNAEEVYISNGTGGSVRLTSAMVDEKLENGTYRYKMYPYVVKLIIDGGSGQDGWHVDCAVVDTMTHSVSYEYNLPSTAVLQESSNLIKPEMKFYYPGTNNVKVGVMTLNGTQVTGDTSVTIYDTNTQSTNEYKFLYWNTEPDGSGTSYNPNVTLPPITENVVLYAIWNHTQTSGTLKLQKKEVFEDADDERKDDGTSYTFTITFANAEAGKSYPYSIYNADNTVKSTDLSVISGGTVNLKNGEYIIVNNVPGGSVTVLESVASNSEFEVSWQVADSNTESDTVTTKVVAGAQTEIVCTNTYTQKTGTLVIEKTVTKANINETLPNDEFTFTVAGDTLVDGQTYSDYVAQNGALTVTITGAGSVTLADLPLGTYTITETSLDNYTTTVNGVAGNSGTVTVTSGGQASIAFENTYKRGDLKVSKTVVGGDATQSFPFTFTVDTAGQYSYSIIKADGTTATGTIANNGTFNLANGDTITVAGLPVGAVYSVTETTHKDYAVQADGANTNAVTGTMDADGQTHGFINTYIRTSLTIKKSGIADTNQSTIYKVYQVDGSNLYSIATVTIHENGSVTIDGLTVGATYQVVEQTDWSWRYTNTNNPQNKVLTANPAENVVSFENTRSNGQWLSGDNWAVNVFGSTDVNRGRGNEIIKDSTAEN